MEGTAEFEDLAYGMASSGINNTDFSDSDQESEDGAPIPTTPVEYGEEFVKTHNNDDEAIKNLRKELNEAGAELGVIVTEEMWNTVVASSSTYSVDMDSMRWFIMGITYSNNQRMIPQINSVISDLQNEIKLIKGVNSQLKTTSTDIVKKMVSVKDDIFAGFSELRANVLDKIVEITTAQSEASAPKHEIVEETKKTNKVEKLIIKEHPSGKIHDKPESSNARNSETKLMEQKRKIAKICGVNPKYYKKLTEVDLDYLVTDGDVYQIMYGDNDDEKTAVLEEIKTRIMVLEME